jgi:DNA-binding IclR family transcriptional regulator
MRTLAASYDAVMQLLLGLPHDVGATAKLVANELDLSEAEAARLLAELEALGLLTSAEPGQH